MSMWLLFLFILLAIAALCAIALRGRAPGERARFPFSQCRPLSEREQVLYWRLRKVLPDQMILAQVAISRILRVDRGNNSRAWLNRINRMTVDFLVCLPDASIVAAIELDDASHLAADRIAADAKKENALSSAHIKLLRYRELPSEDEIRTAFLG